MSQRKSDASLIPTASQAEKASDTPGNVVEEFAVEAPAPIHRWNIVHHCKGQTLRFWILVVACVSFCFFGYDQGMTAGVNASNHYVELMGYGYIDENNETQVTNGLLEGGIVAVYYLGALLGCFLGGWAGDRYGRVKGIAIGAVWGIVGAVLQCTAMNVPWMCVARIINGIGTGILNCVVPVWVTEVADHSSRGQMISIEFSLNIFGVVIAYWLAYGLSFIDNGNSQIRWRFPIAFQIFPLLILITVVWFFPESPRWLVKDGRRQEAQYVLVKLRGNNNAETQREFADICESTNREKRFIEVNGATNYWTMMVGSGKGGLHLTRRTYLIVWLQIIQEWVGVAGVTVYAPVMFRNAGFSAHTANLISGINNISYCISTLIPVFTLDRYGRKNILYVGAVLQALAMAAAGGLSKLNDDGAGVGYGQGAAGCIFAFTFVFGATWLCVPWVYQTEIFPLEVRVKGASFGVVGWAIGNGWLTLLCPIMFQNIGPWTLVVFGICSLSTIPMVWALYPETNNRKLEDIEYLFNIASPWVWDAEKNYAAHMRSKAARLLAEMAEDGKGGETRPEQDAVSETGTIVNH